MKAQYFVWGIGLVKVTETAWYQLVWLAACRLLALGVGAAGKCFVHPLPAPAQAGLGCAAGVGVEVCGGHLTDQVQVQGLRDSS